jgi:nitric oxide reductase activation protein
MARDRELLSDKDFFRKTSDIAEHMRNCKITVVFWDDDNKVIQDQKDVKKFMLNVATPAKKGIEKFTAFNHEIGHIIMESPIPEANKLVTGWVDEFILQHRIAYNDTIVPERVRDTYWNMMNLLEDQRIESLMRRLWLANEKRFDKALKKTGKLHKECNDNPVSVMLNIRFFRKDLVKDHDNVELFTKALNDVENTGRLGALIVLKRLKPVMDKWLKESLNEDFPPSFEVESLDGRDTALMETDESLIKEKNIEEIIDDIESDEDYEKELTKSMEEGTYDLNELRSSLSEQVKENPLRPSYVKPVKRHPVEYNIDHHLSHSLKNVFRKISEMPKNIIGYDGDELDIETYIENKIRGYNINKCFEDKKIDHGLSVVISIDGSGSMERGQKMSKARDLVSTLFHSVKDFPSVELKANVWSSDNKGNVGVTDINSLDDCKNVTNRVLSSNGNFPYTPTHLAIDYASRVAKSMKGRKKLIIMITDGEPQYQSWGYAISPSTLLKMNRKSLLKAKRNVTEIVVFAVDVNNYQLNNLRYIFNRKRVVYIRKMDEGVKLISNKFKLAVLDTLK